MKKYQCRAEYILWLGHGTSDENQNCSTYEEM